MIIDKIDYNKYYEKQDLLWNKIPHKWQEAPFLGNGFAGCTVYFTEDDRSMLINLGHTKIYDDREIDPKKDETLIKIPRLNIGYMKFTFDEKISSINMRLSIYNAVLSGELKSGEDIFSFQLYCLNDIDCFYLKTDGDIKCKVEYVSRPAISPRVVILRRNGEDQFNDYDLPRAPVKSVTNDINMHYQPYFNNGGYCVAYKISDKECIFSCAQSEYDHSSSEKAAELINDMQKNKDKYLNNHKRWWNEYYKNSFMSLDDGKYENFYNIQLYKLACASRENGMPFDTCGPWLTNDTRWPGTWWNLNVELTVSPLYVSNHIEIAKCVSNTLKNSFEDLINNVPEKYRNDCAALGRSTERTLFSPVTEPGNLASYNSSREAGNLIWALFYVYQEYRMTCNKNIAEEVLYPLIKRAVKYYSYFLYPDCEGKLHLKATLSPEYLKSDSEDVNYDLALLKWGCKTLLEITEVLNIEDKDIGLWNNILEKLIDYPTEGEHGLMIAAKTPYAESHRHYSHILAFYPLHLLDRDIENERILVENTINYWQSKKEALLGYSQSGAASMYAMLRNGNKALFHLENLFKGFICPNTMYHEDGNPVLETPPSAATAMLEMIIQSHDGYIELFPALPDKWKNICFANLLCYDGFEVSASLKNGIIEWIDIKNQYENCVKLKNNFDISKYCCNSEYYIKDNIIIFKESKELNITIQSDTHCHLREIENNAINYFGLN